ncbi:MAG: FAD-binding and (Fe-S)-binding domain-containing protein [Vicinamibacterales bacterium]
MRSGTRPALEEVLGRRVAGEVSFTAGARALYATDASNYRQVPIGVVWPRTADDVCEVVRTCREYRVPILPRGAGTSLAGQCCNAAIVLDMSRHLNGVLAVDAERKTARVQPGLVLDDLQRAVTPLGLMYGPDPATHAWCTLGGMIGNNSCGVHSVVAGLTSDVIDALDVLTPDGERMVVGRGSPEQLEARCREPGRVGEIHRRLRTLRDEYGDDVRARYPRIPRRVSGYNLEALLPEHGCDIARALVGTEGTCVTVLEATVRLMAAPRARALLVLGFRDIYGAADEVMRVLEAQPIGVEAIDEVLVGNLKRKARLPRERELLPDGQAWLLVEFGADSVGEAGAAAQSLHQRLSSGWFAPAGRVFTDPDEIAMVWTIRESGLGATAFVPGESATWEGWEDAAVAPERLGAYLRDFRRLLKRYAYRGALYGHFGQGCVHTRTDFDLVSPAGIAKFRAFIHEAADLVVEYGGSLSGEHGDGQSRAELLPKMFGDRLVGAFRDFKRIWDPDGLMNPGKVVDPYAATEYLRRPGYQPRPARSFFRLAAEGDIGGAALRCVGVGKCRKTEEGTMCPSYMVTRDEQHSTRGRAHLLFEMLRGETLTSGWESADVKHALDLCLACKACKSECPVGVDMATYKAEFLAHHYDRLSRPLRAHLFGHVDWWAELAARAPRVVNAFASVRPAARLLQSLAGIAPDRRLPRFAPETFQAWWRRHPPRSEGRRLVLWSDTFTNYFYPEVGRAAVNVLERLGYHVVVPAQTCCGRPLYDFGLLDSAREHLDAMFSTLVGALKDDTRIVVLEPSCFAVFRDEAVGLHRDQRIAQALADRTVLFTSFVREHLERDDLPHSSRHALVHVHCHQRALLGTGDAIAAGRAAGLEVQMPDAGCCGMAGSFGFDREHYPVSIGVGERVLLPAVRAAPDDTVIIADGFSCREQIRQRTQCRAYHFAEVLARHAEAS